MPLGRIENWFTKTKDSDLSKPFHLQPLRFRFYVNLLEFARRLKFYDVEIVGVGIIAAVMVIATVCNS